MIEWLRKIITPHLDDEELNRRAFNLNVILLATFVVVVLGIVAMLLQVGKQPLLYMLSNTMFLVLAALIMVLCYYLSRKGRVQAGSIIFITMMMVACLGAIVVGGMQGALAVILVIPIATAGVTLGSNTSLALTSLSVVTLVVVGFLERNGIIHVQYPAPEMTILLNMFDVGFGLFFVATSVWLAGYSLRQSLERTQQAVVETNHYRQELEKSLSVEQVMRDRLQRAIGEYATFLERIGRGDHEARLSLTEEDRDLALLERQINATVDALVTAVAQSEAARQEVEAAHRRYLLQEWRVYVRSKPATDFEVAQPDVAVPGETLLPALKEALSQRRTVTLARRDGQEREDGTPPYAALVTPMMLRGGVVGALRICREAGERPWTDDERALVEAVTERLVLAADNLRLLEDTQRRAAREQLTGEVTARVRETLDMDTVLQTAIREIGEALGLAEVEVRMGSGPVGDPPERGEVRS